MSSEKRCLPPALVKLLEWDKAATKKLFDMFDRQCGYAKNRQYLHALEISCHGLIWLGATVALLYFGFSPLIWVNFLALLLVDIVIVASLKAFTRRRRPTLNAVDMYVTIGPDKFSFPSGHASRGFAVAFFFLWLYPLHIIISVPILAWGSLVAMSRVCLARHHILDVVGGLAVAIVEYVIMNILWVDEAKAQYLANYFADTEDPWSSG